MLSAAILGSSSLVIVPDLANLTAAQALTALSNAELLVGTTSTTTSGATSGNNNQIASQSIAAGTLVERYTAVNYATYAYVAPPPPPGPATPPPGPDCSNCIDDDTGYCTDVNQTTGYGNYYQYQYDPTGTCPACAPRFVGNVLCQAPAPSPPSISDCSPGQAAGCIDDDMTYCSGYDLYTTRYNPSIACNCSGRLIESNSAACGYVSSGGTPPSPPSGGGNPSPSRCTPSCTECDPLYPTTQTCIDSFCNQVTIGCN